MKLSPAVRVIMSPTSVLATMRAVGSTLGRRCFTMIATGPAPASCDAVMNSRCLSDNV